MINKCESHWHTDPKLSESRSRWFEIVKLRRNNLFWFEFLGNQRTEGNEDGEFSENVRAVESDARSHQDDLDGCHLGDHPDFVLDPEIRRLKTRFLPRSCPRPWRWVYSEVGGVERSIDNGALNVRAFTQSGSDIYQYRRPEWKCKQTFKVRRELS